MKYMDKQIVDAVKISRSYAEVMRSLGIDYISGSMQSNIKVRINNLNCDISHFLGQGWNKGNADPKRLDADEILVYHRSKKNRRENIKRLRRALKEKKVKYECVDCGLNSLWRGSRLVLEIHHRNSDPLDNRIENLCYLCPNCHSQK